MSGKGIAGLSVLPALAAVMAVAMGVTALYAGAVGEDTAAAVFGGWALVILAFAGLAHFATRGRAGPPPGPRLRGDVWLLLFVWLGLPALAALPVQDVAKALSYLEAWFEMISGLTTTGATLLAEPGGQPRSLLLWRSLMQWGGGALTLVAILAVLAPRRLGVFPLAGVAPHPDSRAQRDGGGEGWGRSAARVVPLYAVATALLFAAYLAVGMGAFDAVNHAMATLSTGGFSTRSDGIAAFASPAVETVAVCGMLLGAIGVGAYGRLWRRQWRRLAENRELRLLALLLALSAAAAILRHYLAEPGETWDGRFAALPPIAWSEVFLAVSALTTTGYSSAFAGASEQWSGLGPAAALLLGLAVAGGSAVSTAGGIRLMSLSLMMQHSFDEVGRIGRPRHVRGRRPFPDSEGFLQVAWITSMLFACTAAGGVLAISALGVDFATSLSAVVTSLANAGPLHGIVTGDAAAWERLPSGVLVVCALLMCLGRMGVVALAAALFASLSFGGGSR